MTNYPTITKDFIDFFNAFYPELFEYQDCGQHKRMYISPDSKNIIIKTSGNIGLIVINDNADYIKAIINIHFKNDFNKYLLNKKLNAKMIALPKIKTNKI